jgi:hypothetical protein
VDPGIGVTLAAEQSAECEDDVAHAVGGHHHRDQAQQQRQTEHHRALGPRGGQGHGGGAGLGLSRESGGGHRGLHEIELVLHGVFSCQ